MGLDVDVVVESDAYVAPGTQETSVKSRLINRVDTHTTPAVCVCSPLKILERPAERIAHTFENHSNKKFD